MPVYYIPKTSDTYSDILIAWGFSRILADLVAQAKIPGSVWIEDGGTHFIVRSPQTFDPDRLKELDPKLFTYYLVKRTEDYQKKYITNVVFLDAEYDKAKLSRVGAKSLAVRNTQIENAAHPLLAHFGAMTSLSADDIVNTIFDLQPVERKAYVALIEVLIQLFGFQGLSSIQLVKALKAAGLPTNMVTTGAMLNPTQGKGDNRIKPIGANPSNMSALWIWEWLKIIGFHEAAIAANFKDGQGRVREYRIAVLVPKRISLLTHRRVYERFLKTYYLGSGLKMDCLVGLNYAEAFFEYLQEESALAGSILESEDTLNDLIRGFQAASFFKNSQHTFAVSRVTNYSLPGWVYLPDPYNQTAVQKYRSVLQDHRKCVRNLDEDRGEQVTMLEKYRDWISSGSQSACLDFFARYAEHRMRCAADKKPCPAFTTTNLEVILVSDSPHDKPLSPILENVGFRNIATAIRKGTINAQYLRNSKPVSKLPSGMNVHFELSHELRRNAPHRDKFMATICQYLNTYNLENSRVSSRGEHPGRSNIQTDTIEAFVQLVDVYGSELICGLLLAYGYAKEPFDRDMNEQDAADNGIETEGEHTSE